MIRILIVDDEPAVCEGTISRLAKMALPGLAPSVGFVTAAGAVAFVDQNPHESFLILADITMPGMSGLEMMREIQKRPVTARFIALSAHSDFVYVQEALRLGADDYLLKPVLLEQFHAAVRRGVGRLQAELERRRENPPLASVLDTLAFVDSADIQAALEAQPSFATGGCFTVLLFDEAIDWRAHADARFTVFPFHKGRALLLGHAAQANARGMAEGLLAAASGRAHVGISAPGGAREIPLLYAQAVRMLRAAVLLPSRAAYAPQECAKSAALQLTDAQQARLERMIWSLDAHAYGRALAELLADGLTGTHRFEAIDRLYGTLARGLQGAAATFSAQGVPLPESLTAFGTIAAARQALCAYFDALCASVAEKLGYSAVERSIRYTRDHLDNVDMAAVASTINVSYSYFSQLFKKTTGKTFSNYLQELKMECALELLREGDQVQAVAQRLGYTNSKNFTRAFKRHYGVSPSGWRQLVNRV